MAKKLIVRNWKESEINVAAAASDSKKENSPKMVGEREGALRIPGLGYRVSHVSLLSTLTSVVCTQELVLL